MALFEHNDADGKYYCTLLSCQPLSSCMFVPNQFSSYSYIVELRTANKTESELKLEEEEVREEQKVEALLNGEGRNGKKCWWKYFSLDQVGKGGIC